MRTPCVIALLASAALPAAAQQPTRTLTKPLAEYGEPFSQIAAVRELKDGRLLVVDSRDKLVQLVNLTANSATKVGREGSGPGEYGLPTQLFALPGDSSVIFDPLNQRYLMVLPDGKPGVSFRVGDEPSAPPRPQQGQRPEGGGRPHHQRAARRVAGRERRLAAPSPHVSPDSRVPFSTSCTRG